MSMIIIMPKQIGNAPLNRIEAGLDDLDLANLTFEEPQAFDVFLPKFKLDVRCVHILELI